MWNSTLAGIRYWWASSCSFLTLLLSTSWRVTCWGYEHSLQNVWFAQRGGFWMGKGTLYYYYYYHLLLKVKHCVCVPAGSPAIGCGCMDHQLLGSEVVLVTWRVDHNETYLPGHPSNRHWWNTNKQRHWMFIYIHYFLFHLIKLQGTILFVCSFVQLHNHAADSSLHFLCWGQVERFCEMNMCFKAFQKGFVLRVCVYCSQKSVSNIGYLPLGLVMICIRSGPPLQTIHFIIFRSDM